jgi:two-component system LytT family response regulator
MPEIRVLVVDDEPLARRGICQLLAAHPDMRIVGECRNGREALRALEALEPDLVFLDVQMPDIDGFGVIRTRGVERMPAVVFVTAHDEFAVRAFEANALDYLVKPLSQLRFDTTLQRVRERTRIAGAVALASRLAAVLGGETGSSGRRTRAAPASPAGLVVTTPSGQLVLDADDITWIEARDYYAGVHAGGNCYLLRESLRTLERRLDPARFMRVHRSAILRLDQVKELRTQSGGRVVVILREGTRIRVSRRRAKRLRSLLRLAPA